MSKEKKRIILISLIGTFILVKIIVERTSIPDIELVSPLLYTFLFAFFEEIIKWIIPLFQGLYKKLKLYHFTIPAITFWLIENVLYLIKLTFIGGFFSSFITFISRMLTTFVFHFALSVLFYILYKKFKKHSNRFFNFFITAILIFFTTSIHFILNYSLDNFKTLGFFIFFVSLIFSLSFLWVNEEEII